MDRLGQKWKWKLTSPPSKIARAVNELYRSYNTNQSPFVVLDIQTPLDAVDVNVSPDKREIFVHSENNLIEALKVGHSIPAGLNMSSDRLHILSNTDWTGATVRTI